MTTAPKDTNVDKKGGVIVEGSALHDKAADDKAQKAEAENTAERSKQEDEKKG